MTKVGITGQAGFIGGHLYNYLGLKENISRIPFEDDYFGSSDKLKDFARKCDVIVHLAAMNRHKDDNILYNTNIDLVNKLVRACEETGSRPHILFSSSIQESGDNAYGRSKRLGRELLEKWAGKNNATFTGMLIPNVFGPFGLPFYNSVIATFCHQLTHDENPEIIVDAELNLIYINDLVEEIYRMIVGLRTEQVCLNKVTPGMQIRVSSLLELLRGFREQYLLNKIIPSISTPFELALFNTFRSYIPDDHFPVPFQQHQDERGSFVEVLKARCPGQCSYSTTKPGITRGNHFHIRKVERFAVISGNARIQLRRIGTGKVIEYHLGGDHVSFVDMPVWYTHNITNTGRTDLVTLFWINEFFDPADPDTFSEKV